MKGDAGIGSCIAVFVPAFAVKARFPTILPKDSGKQSLWHFSTVQSAYSRPSLSLPVPVSASGAINLLEGYGNDNPGAKSQGMKQLMAGGGVALIGITSFPAHRTVRLIPRINPVRHPPFGAGAAGRRVKPIGFDMEEFTEWLKEMLVSGIMDNVNGCSTM